MEKLNDFELDKVAGGRYFVNTDNKMVCFQNIAGAYTLKCSPYQAMEAMDALIGKYATEAEYDQACFEMLKSNGWI